MLVRESTRLIQSAEPEVDERDSESSRRVAWGITLLFALDLLLVALIFLPYYRVYPLGIHEHQLTYQAYDNYLNAWGDLGNTVYGAVQYILGFSSCLILPFILLQFFLLPMAWQRISKVEQMIHVLFLGFAIVLWLFALGNSTALLNWLDRI